MVGQLTLHQRHDSAAADLMRVTLRQTHRLLKRYRDGGAPAIANRRRGRPSNNRLSDVVRDHAIALVREYYADFGPTLAAEKLGERHDVRVSRETLRGWMRQAGLRLLKKEPRSTHRFITIWSGDVRLNRIVVRRRQHDGAAHSYYRYTVSRSCPGAPMAKSNVSNSVS